MKKILILGAGRSSSSLIRYLLRHSQQNGWAITIGDVNVSHVVEAIAGYPHASAIQFDVFNDQQKNTEIANADLVISMLPVSHHIEVLKACLQFKKNFISASYVSGEIKSLQRDIENSGITVIKECGLDPGLDHMSAMEVIDSIRDRGGKLKSFRSYTGGLMAPESDNNPWKYKITWNPRNVALAGQGVAKYLQNGQYKFIPYHKLFSRIDKIQVDGYGEFEGYANRDSLSYRSIYQIEDVGTLLRGTLRKTGYCEAWNVFVQLGLTDDAYILEESGNMSYRDLINAFLPFDAAKSVEDKLVAYLGLNRDSDIFRKIEWLGILEDKPIGIENASPARALQKLIEEKWKLGKDDKDMIVMQHQFEYEIGGKSFSQISELVVIGENPVHTAMAKTVGLPMAIVAKLMLSGRINLKGGLYIPVIKEIYEPVLSEMSQLGVKFSHKHLDNN